MRPQPYINTYFHPDAENQNDDMNTLIAEIRGMHQEFDVNSLRQVRNRMEANPE